MRRREDLLLAEMIDAAEQAIEIAAETTAEALQADRRLHDALLWNFTVLGEAATQLSAEFKAMHPEVAWGRPSQLRNRIVHGYWSVDPDILLTTATDELPGFVDALRTVAEKASSIG